MTTKETVENFGCRLLSDSTKYKSVGHSKNALLDYLFRNEKCTHVFLIEDDIIVKDGVVFEEYIKTAADTGILHLNYGYHGPANKVNGVDTPRLVVRRKNSTLALNYHSVGAFSYYHKKFYENVGVHRPEFKNAWEHVELCARAVERGYLPAFWWFPDVFDSSRWLTEIEGSIQNSSIRHTKEWTENMKKGAQIFKNLYGFIPIHMPDTPQNEVLDELIKIKSRHYFVV